MKDYKKYLFKEQKEQYDHEQYKNLPEDEKQKLNVYKKML